MYYKYYGEEDKRKKKKRITAVWYKSEKYKKQLSVPSYELWNSEKRLKRKNKRT